MGSLVAQTAPSSTLRDRMVAVLPGGQLIDSLTVAPGSVVISPATPHQVSGRFLIWDTVDLPDSVRIRYRVLPFALDATVRLLDSSQ